MSQVPEKEGKVQLECLHDDSVCEGPTLDKCVLIFLKELQVILLMAWLDWFEV